MVEKDHIGLSDKEYKAIQDNVVELCDETSQSAISIIDAIAVPDHILNSFLGSSNGKVYENYLSLVENCSGCYENPAKALMKDIKNLY